MAKKRTRATHRSRTTANTGGTAKRSRTRASVRSLAAKKGWATRRAAATKRSLAAKKGWNTRRANERKRKHSRKVAGKTMARAERAREKLHGPIATTQFAVSADYRSRKAGSAVTIQIAAIGPAGATIADADAAVTHKINRGRAPAGWTVRIVNWRGSEWRGEPIEPDPKIEDAWKKLHLPLALAEFGVSPVGKG